MIFPMVRRAIIGITLLATVPLSIAQEGYEEMVFEEALDIAQVARESREKAEAGDAAAQLQLARCYFTGSFKRA